MRPKARKINTYLKNNGELLIEYQKADNQQLQQIRSYLQANPSKNLRIGNLEMNETTREKASNSNQTNYLLIFV